MRDALAVSLGAFPGATTALSELAAATDLLHHVAIGGGGRGPDARFVEELLETRAVRLLVLGGWSRAYSRLVRIAARRGVAVAVYWTSTCGQSEIGREIDRLDAVLEDRRITYRWFAQRALAHMLARRVDGCDWLPVVTSTALEDIPAGARKPRTPRAELGLFCSPHEYHRKNVLTSLLAVAALERPARLHLNGLSADPFYHRWMERLRLRRIDHGWMPRTRYLRRVRSLDLGLQVSFAESFNYVAADHLLAGTAVVVSPMVAAVRELPRASGTPFIVGNADDPLAVAGVIRGLLDRRTETHRAVRAARAALIEQQRTHLATATALLRSALGRS